MKKRLLPFITLLAIGITATHCSTKDDVFASEELAEYLQLATGKYIIYQLDSTVRVPLTDTTTVTRRYQAKDVIDGSISDNLGRASWRVIRYLRDSAGTTAWVPNLTYMITPTRETVEVIENNLRFQKLKLPVRDGFNWKGNTHIDTYSTNSDVRYLDDWTYLYENHTSPFVVFSTTVPNTITVNQRDEILGTPNNPDAYSETNISKEVYAKNIGLIYKEFAHWVFQPRNSTFPIGYKEGFAIKLRMLEHN
jgi:hypothetical protein